MVSSFEYPGNQVGHVLRKSVQHGAEDAYAMCRRLAREEGVFVGPSAAANVVASLRVAREWDGPAVIVTILCDGGGKYLSEKFWDEP